MLVVRELEVTYQGVIAAVRGVSLEVPDRGVVALLGANGAGKTTILRAISGLLQSQGGRITQGSVEFDGQPITALDATRIVRLGIAQVLEGRRLFAELTVDENLRTGAFAARDAAATRRAYDRVMEIFPVLRNRRRSAAGYLSGGEQQMLAIGRGLMGKPTAPLARRAIAWTGAGDGAADRRDHRRDQRGRHSGVAGGAERADGAHPCDTATCWRPAGSRWTSPPRTAA